MTRLPALSIALALALALTACGGAEESSVTTDGEPQSTSTATAAKDGGQLFNATCGGCHTLAAADTEGVVGPDLDEEKPDEQTVLDAVEEGPGAMPANLLKGEDAQAVATFVAENAGG